MPLSDRDRIYTVNEAVAKDLASLTGGRGVPLIVGLRGYIDAGHAGEQLVDHLRAQGERLVSFDTDLLVDHRSRRPTVDFDSGSFSNYESHQLGIDMAVDSEGVPFLVMHGVEPDYRWNHFIDAATELIEQFGVDLTVHTHGIPMAMPHTRPAMVTYSATRDDLITQPDPTLGVFGKVTIPAGVSNALHVRLGELGRDAVGMAVHVPHYVAQSQYPPAVMVLADQLAHTTGLVIDSTALHQRAADAIDEVATKVAESGEMAALVQALEQQFDAFARGRSENSLLADNGRLPSADDIAAEFEQFLAEQHPEQP
ncbi:PAC2 family protein [Micrococcales bacterium KH10]|nr:PAC2 family protein [Micrococcales bacterium KH10]